MWYKLFMDGVNRHATIRHKRVKYSKMPPWLNKNIIRPCPIGIDQRNKQCSLNIKRHAINIFVRNAKKLYFRRLVENNIDISSVWRALNIFTKGTNFRQKEIQHHFTADTFNDYFVSIAETFVKSQDSPDSDKHCSCSKRLVDFGQQETKGTDPFTVPLVAVNEIGKYISGMTIKSFPELTKSSISCLN